MNLPILMRATCSNVLRQAVVRHHPRVIHKAASVAPWSRLKPVAWQCNATMTTRRFTAGAENNTVDYDYIQTIIKDKKQVNILL